MNPDFNDVVVTGLGPVTSVGVGKDELWGSLVAGRQRVEQRELIVAPGQTADLPMASMPEDGEVQGMAPHLEFLEAQGCAGHRDLAYALLAVEMALADAGVEFDRQANDVGVIQAFEAPAVEHAVCRLFGLLDGPPPAEGPPPLYDLLAPSYYNMQPFYYVHLMGKALGLHGYCTSVHNACAAGAFAIDAAAQQIRSGRTDIMVVAGGEAFETAVRLEWFRRLELYAADRRLRPFDLDQSGFFVGEGAGAMVLESAAHAKRRGAYIYAAYQGGVFAHQGWKQTVPDVRAARLTGVIRRTMAGAGVEPDQLSLIVPHGAATLLSDKYEGKCLLEALDGAGSGAVVTAFKPYVGHMLAASGIIETICGLLSMRHQEVPATLHTGSEQVELGAPLATEHLAHPVDSLLKLSTGFTGHDAALLFGRV